MPRNASGVMSLTSQFAVPNAIPSSTTINSLIGDIVNEITNSLDRSGKGGMLAALAMGGNKITGLAPGVAGTDATTLVQVQTNVSNHAISVGGTGDAITATFSPAITSYATNLAIRITAAAANTITAPTINADGLGTRTIKKNNSQALAAGDIAGAGHILALVYDGTNFELLNPAGSGGAPLNSPTFTGDPKAPTPAVGDNDTSLATTAFCVAGFEPLGAYVAVNDQTGTTYTFALTDVAKLVSGNNAGAQTFTVPPNSSVAFPTRSRFDLWQKGAGQITIAAGVGVTLNSSGGKLKLAGQYSACSLVKTATDTWLVFGDLSA